MYVAANAVGRQICAELVAISNADYILVPYAVVGSGEPRLANECVADFGIVDGGKCASVPGLGVDVVEFQTQKCRLYRV